MYIPIHTGGGGKPLPKSFVKYLFFSFGFGVYGFTRGYRAKTSTIKYNVEKVHGVYSGIKIDEKTRTYINKEIKDKANKIFITDKVKDGLLESIFYFLPIFNLWPIINLLKRIEVYSKVSKIDYGEYKVNFNIYYFDDTVCYDII